MDRYISLCANLLRSVYYVNINWHSSQAARAACSIFHELLIAVKERAYVFDVFFVRLHR